MLNRQGYEVLGITFLYSQKSTNKNGKVKNDSTSDISYKCNVQDPKEIKNFCQKLGIQHLGFHSFDEFRDQVIDTCVSFRLKTAQDNPCFNCTKLTFGLLRQKAIDLDADFISTGLSQRFTIVKPQKVIF